MIKRRRWGFIPSDLEGRFKTNYSGGITSCVWVIWCLTNTVSPWHPSAPRYDMTHSLYWKRSPASNTLFSTYLGADAMAQGRWWKTCRLKRTVKTVRDVTLVEIRAAEIRVNPPVSWHHCHTAATRRCFWWCLSVARWFQILRLSVIGRADLTVMIVCEGESKSGWT